MSGNSIRFGSDLDGMRSEDIPLLTGKGQFSDDLNVDGQLHAVFVRSPVAHADIDYIETKEALSIPGVIGIYTGSDLVAANIGDVPAATSINGRDGNPMLHAPVPVLAHKRIRHVGEPVAIVVAKTVASAQDGANAVHLQLRERPAAATVTAALATGAPIIYEDAPDNIALDWTDGDRSTIDATFASATHILETTITDTRLAPVSMERAVYL